MARPNPVRTWWEARVLPRLVDVALSEATSAPWRDLVCAPATGRVVEVGFGSGRNLAHYPPSVREVLAVEPAELGWERAAGRIAEFGRPVRRIGLDGAALPLPDASVDTVVSTWTMCTIGDLPSAITEMRRVLRPGGSLLYVEHVTSPHPGARRIQDRMQPVWGVFSGGCHLNRDIEGMLEAGGFVVQPLGPQPTPRPDGSRFELVPSVAGRATPRP